MSDLLCLFLHGDTPDSWSSYGPSVSRAAEDAATSRQPALFYPESGPSRVAIVPVPEAQKGDEAWRWAGASAARLAGSLKAESVTLEAPDADAASAVAEGFILGAYRFDRYRTGETPPAAPSVTVRLADGAEQDVEAAHARARATNAARDLVNLSPDEKMPADLAEAMREGAEAGGLAVEVWGKERIESEGMGGLLAVNRGSLDPPRFVVIEHAPEGHEDARPVVMVGKAVTYDTGGLSLKPTKNSMDKMKADMAGGAAVYGAMLGLAALQVPLRVIALIPMSDNRPGVRAYVPGDVIHMHSGATVEVLNTDAEGRMLLADGLSYAHSLTPRLAMSVATLTGAQGVALGERVAAVIPREDVHADGYRQLFQTAGEATGDLVWPLPLFPHYREQLTSDVADLKNVGGRMAGTITAAAFLEHFTHDDEGEPAYPYVHLDIARPAFLDSAYGYHPKGASGFGVRLLIDALARLSEGADA
ncbi:MAG: leucyl aminopeptidase family protein [Bacteroidota bacterium]